MLFVDPKLLRHLVQADLHGAVAPCAEGAALRHVQHVDGRAGDGDQLFLHVVDIGDGAKQAPRVLVLRVIKDLMGGAALADAPAVHDYDVVAHVGNDAEVVRHQNDRHTELLLQILHELEYLGLDGHVKGGGRLVGDENVRLAGQGHGDHDALAHAAGELKGVLFESLFRLVDADQGQKLRGARLGVPALFVGVEGNGLDDLAADGKDRVQARHGVLEDDGAAFAAKALHLLFIPGREILSLVEDAAADDFAGVGQDLHDGIGGHGLAGAGFADDAEDLAPVKLKVHAVDGLNLARVGEEGGVQILHA